MEKKELKLKKETLSNLTNLNISEMEEVKGGIVQQEFVTDTITPALTFTWTSWITYTYSVSVM